MPVEISEVYVKINVTDSSGSANEDNGGDAHDMQQAIIKAVVEEVLAILKQKEER